MPVASIAAMRPRAPLTVTSSPTAYARDQHGQRAVQPEPVEDVVDAPALAELVDLGGLEELHQRAPDQRREQQAGEQQAAAMGGKAGTRYHRKIDRIGDTA